MTGEVSHFLHKMMLSLKLVSCGTQDTRGIVTRHQIRGSSAYLLVLYSINMYCKQGLACDRLLTCSLCCYELSGFHTEGKELHWNSSGTPGSNDISTRSQSKGCSHQRGSTVALIPCHSPCAWPCLGARNSFYSQLAYHVMMPSHACLICPS